MFNGFPSTNTPAIQVWDFFSTQASSTVNRIISLTDDCAPIQYFRTGASTNVIRVHLPVSPPEGKVIRFIVARYGSLAQSVNIYSSEARDGTASQSATGVYYATPGKVLELVYCKNAISIGAGGNAETGWLSLTESSVSSPAFRSVALSSAIATGNHAIAAGANATASNNNTVCLGGQNATASGIGSICIGSSQVSGQGAIGIGGSTVSGQDAVALGFSHTANQTSVFASGRRADTRSIGGIATFASCVEPISTTAGTTQGSMLILGVQTTDATATVLRSSTAAAGTTNQVILPNNSAYTFQGTVIANVTGGGNTSSWKFEGAIKRGATAGSTTLVAAVTPTVIAQDAGAAAWVLAITADTTNGGLAVTVTGAAATTIRWVCKIETTEVTF
jgi:uncharacterized membrane protein